jgi:hypothetical protein
MHCSEGKKTIFELPILAGFKEGHDVSLGKFFERFFPGKLAQVM